MGNQKMPPLGSMVLAGDTQTEAVRLNDFIFMSQDISNAYLVTTSGDSVLINAGMASSGPRHKKLFSAVSQAPIAYAVMTQSHPDHFGGLVALKSPETKIVAHADLERNHDERSLLRDFFHPRVAKLWGPVIGANANGRRMPLDFVLDILIKDKFEFTASEREFEVFATPGGETTDSLCVWMPKERVVFTGNLFGPIFLSMPNLYTIRGDKQRPALEYIRSLDKVSALGAEMLVTGHGEPIIGAQKIAEALAKMRAAVMYVHDATIDGMNAGKDIYTLMRDIRVPDNLTLGEGHGKTSWNVRAIWEEYAGWFHYDSTTSLYGVPRSSINADLVQLAGGIAPLAAKAQSYVDDGSPLEAIHLTDIALSQSPNDQATLSAKRAAVSLLLERSNSQNLSETMWLRSELTATDAALTKNA